MAHCHACHAHNGLLIFWGSDTGNRHIFGCRGPEVGLMAPKLELGRYFCTIHLTAKFRHATFNRSEVIVLTNKETDAAENIHLAPLCYVGG